MTLVTRQAMTDDSGTFTDGTAWNKAAVDQVYDIIDDQTHSTTNPTVKPKATTDEVITARGSKASLDARLDIALNEDGTLKALTDASSVVSGIVNLVDQTLGQGIKSVEAGGSSGTAKLGGVVSVNTTPVSNGTTVETDLMTYSVLASMLNANGRALRVIAWGSMANNANQKTIKAYFGATAITLLTTAGYANIIWRAELVIVRTGAAAQKMNGVVNFSNPGTTANAGQSLSNATPGETMSGAVVLKFTGQSNTASGDVTQEGMTVEVLG